MGGVMICLAMADRITLRKTNTEQTTAGGFFQLGLCWQAVAVSSPLYLCIRDALVARFVDRCFNVIGVINRRKPFFWPWALRHFTISYYEI